MTWESRGIPGWFTLRPHGRPHFSTAPVDYSGVGPPRYAAAELVSHIVPIPYEHGFENNGRTSVDREVNR
jgi:hypothetical protein